MAMNVVLGKHIQSHAYPLSHSPYTVKVCPTIFRWIKTSRLWKISADNPHDFN